MAINKKSIQQSDAPEMDDLHAALSKAALMDIVIDLVRRNAGDETLDGVELARAIIEEGSAVLAIRGDKLPNVVAVPRCVRCSISRVRPRCADSLCYGCYGANYPERDVAT